MKGPTKDLLVARDGNARTVSEKSLRRDTTQGNRVCSKGRLHQQAKRGLDYKLAVRTRELGSKGDLVAGFREKCKICMHF